MREVNERIEQVDQQWGIFQGTVSVLCECGNGGCLERIQISATDYEAVRRFPTRFLLKPGHLASTGDSAAAIRGQVGSDWRNSASELEY